MYVNVKDNAPSIGQRVRVKSIPGVTQDDGSNDTQKIISLETVVTAVDTQTDDPRAYGSFEYGYTNDPNKYSNVYYFYEWEPVNDIDMIHLPTIGASVRADSINDATKELLMTMDVELANSRQQTIKRNEDVSAWKHWALAVIERADSEADERGWCETYDNIRDHIVNQAPSDPGFPEYGQKEWNVYFTVTGTMTTTMCVTVSAKSQDAAEELANEMIFQGYEDPDSALTDAASNNTFEDIETTIDVSEEV